MKIAVFGAGGVGGYFGARLAQAGADVHLIARGEHLRALRDVGLQVHSEKGDVSLRLPATDRPQDVGPCDVVLFCVKATDTHAAAQTLSPLLKNETAVITLQNGVDNENTIAEVVGDEHVVGGVAYIFATIDGPGIVAHNGTLARIVFGEMDGAKSARGTAFLAHVERAGIDAELSVHIRAELWKKFAMICATAGMTAAVRLPVGEIRTSEAARRMYAQLVNEVVEVARAEGVSMPSGLAEETLAVLEKLPGSWFSSLHYDLTHGKPMELDALHGTVVRLAAKHALRAPANEAVYGVLEPWALRNRASK